ncbi:MAG: phosphoethanolamine--lipid A transferase [Xylophilus ampelinus]
MKARALNPITGIAPISPVWLVLAVSAFMTFVGNGALWHRLVELDLIDGLNGKLFAAAIWLTLGAALAALLGLFAWRPTLKPAIIVLLFSTVVARHFMNSYNVLITPAMLTNALQTDRQEASALFSASLLASLVFLAALPAWLVWRLPVAYGSVRRQLWRNPALTLGSLAIAVAAVLVTFQPLASANRNYKDLRFLVNPLASVTAIVRLAAKPFERKAGPLLVLGDDAHLAPQQVGNASRPRLLLLVLGETARSDRFAINGYGRPTTPELEREGVISFRNAWSCGTSTAESLPCMFSHLPREQYLQRTGDYENLLDVLQRAGLAVLWLDNQSGCKGVCARVPNAATAKTSPTGLCTGEECLDGVMLEQLDARLKALDPAKRERGVVVVMHQMGSHGPAYSQRSPASAKKFLPECTSNSLQDCDPESLRNAYDNSIAYTDRFLGQAIEWLKRNPTNTDNALLYVSDHGESLGEGNLYLHGMPYALAPDVQKHVPWVTWLSADFARVDKLSEACLRGRGDARVSHDEYFHSVLGLMGVSTRAYQPALDAYLPCRDRTTLVQN